MLDNLSGNDKITFLSRSVSKVIPNNLNLFTSQFSFHFFFFIDSVLYFFEPIHTTCVLEKLTLRPENFAYYSRSYSVSSRVSLEPSNLTVVSSTNWDRIKSLLLIFIPFIFSVLLIFVNKTFA